MAMQAELPGVFEKNVGWLEGIYVLVVCGPRRLLAIMAGSDVDKLFYVFPAGEVVDRK